MAWPKRASPFGHTRWLGVLIQSIRLTHLSCHLSLTYWWSDQEKSALSATFTDASVFSFKASGWHTLTTLLATLVDGLTKKSPPFRPHSLTIKSSYSKPQPDAYQMPHAHIVSEYKVIFFGHTWRTLSTHSSQPISPGRKSVSRALVPYSSQFCYLNP